MQVPDFMIMLLKFGRGLSQELNYNIMFSQRGVMNLAHNLQDVRDLKEELMRMTERDRRCLFKH